MSEPERIGELLSGIMQDIRRRMERRELKKRCFTNRRNYFRHKKSVLGSEGFGRIDEPDKVRCFGMPE
jgi:hypothetical protein